MCKEKSHFVSALDRRQLLKVLSTMGVSMAVLRCGGAMQNADFSSGSSGSGTTDGSSSGSCVEMVSETNGPFPADGSNSAGDGNSTLLDDVYANSPIIRSNIVSNYDGTQTVSGVPLTLTMTLQNTNNSCEILSGYYIYIWHCTPAGQYSAYTGSGNGTHTRTETYLRGIQQTNASGQVTFTTVYPGWYSGRTVHIHVEVYKTLADSTTVKTTQLAFPMSTNYTVQSASGYNGTSGMMTNSSDGIFSDGTSTEMVTISGDNTNGYQASIAIRVAA